MATATAFCCCRQSDLRLYQYTGICLYPRMGCSTRDLPVVATLPGTGTSTSTNIFFLETFRIMNTSEQSVIYPFLVQLPNDVMYYTVPDTTDTSSSTSYLP